jgi:hypothetical protein
VSTYLKRCLVAIGWSLGAIALSGCIVEQGDLDAETPVEGEVESYDDAEPFDAQPFEPGLADEAELYEETEPHEEAALQAAFEPTVGVQERASHAADDGAEEVVFPTNLGADAEKADGDPNNPDPTPWQSTREDENPDPTPWRYPWSTQAQASFHPND